MFIYDHVTHKRIEMPEKMKQFLDDIHAVCIKHNLSIAHEDYYGAFIVEPYSNENIDWLFQAQKNYKERN